MPIYYFKYIINEYDNFNRNYKILKKNLDNLKMFMKIYYFDNKT